MGVALVADVPDEPVFGRIEDIVYRSCQFDHSQAGAQMSTGNRHGAYHFGTQFVSNLPELFRLQFAEIVGILDCIEQWSFGSV